MNYYLKVFLSSNIIWNRNDSIKESDEIENVENLNQIGVENQNQERKVLKENDLNFLLISFNKFKKIDRKKISIKILQYLTEYFNYKEAIYSYFKKSLTYTNDIFYIFQIINSEYLELINGKCYFYYFENFNSISLYFLDYMLPHIKDISKLKNYKYKYINIRNLLTSKENFTEDYEQLFLRLLPRLTLEFFDDDSINLKNYLISLFYYINKSSINIIKILSPLMIEKFFDIIYFTNTSTMWITIITDLNEYKLEIFEFFQKYLKHSYFSHEIYKGTTLWKVIFSQTKTEYQIKFLNKFKNYLTKSDIFSKDGLGNNLFHILFSNIYNKYSVEIFEKYLLQYLQVFPSKSICINKRKETCLHCLFENISIYSYQILKKILKLNLLKADYFSIQNDDKETCLHFLFKQIDKKSNLKVLKLILPLINLDMLSIENIYKKTPLHYLLIQLNSKINEQDNKLLINFLIKILSNEKVL